MSSQTKFAGSVFSAPNWTDYSNILSEDGSFAYYYFYQSPPSYSTYLHPHNFGFSIPSGATIQGIAVGVKGKVDNSSYYVIPIVTLGTYSDPNFTALTDERWVGQFSTSNSWLSAGGASDLWSYGSWTPSIFNGTPHFAVRIRLYSDTQYIYGYVDAIKVTVYYQESITLSVNSATHSFSLASPTLIQNYTLSPSSLLHSFSVSPSEIIQNIVLQLSKVTHSTLTESPAFIQDVVLELGKLTHSVTTNNLDIFIGVALEVQDILMSAGIESPTIQQLHNLVLQNILHSHATGSLEITEEELQLIVQHVAHAFNIESVEYKIWEKIIQDYISWTKITNQDVWQMAGQDYMPWTKITSKDIILDLEEDE